MHKNQKIILNLGAGVGALYKAPYRTWGSDAFYVNVDKFLTEKQIRKQAMADKGINGGAVWEEGATFVQADILKLPFPDNYADGIEMHQVIEHLSWWQTVPAIKEVYRVLKPKAKFILSAPNFNALAKDWVENCWYEEYLAKNGTIDIDAYINRNEEIFGNQRGLPEFNGEIHKCAINPRFMQYLFSMAGFKKINVICYAKGSNYAQSYGTISRAHKGFVLRFETVIGLAWK
jgi:SAM-dependent methyltransferase